jgi:hypothetical protein
MHNYHMDAEFHARVEMTMQFLNFDLHNGEGRYMNDDELALARLAASVALVCVGLHPSTGEPL